MRCVKCGAENSNGAINCAYCGDSLVNTFGEQTVESVNGVVVNNVEQPIIQQTQVQQPVNNTTVTNQTQTINSNYTGVVSGVVNNTNVVEPMVNSNINNVGVAVSAPSQVQSVSIMNAELVNGQQPIINNIGSVLPTNGQTTTTNEKKNKMLKIVLVVMVILLIASIGLAVWVYFKGQEKIEEHNKLMENRVEITWTPGGKNQYNAGNEVILVDNSSWYVISQNGDIVTLLAKDVYGESTYFSNSVNDYENSLVKGILETKYLPLLSNSLTNNGGNVNDLKVRIISVDEIRKIANIGEDVLSDNIELDESYKWLYQPGNYWTNTQKLDGNNSYEYVVTDFNVFGNIETDSGLTGGRKFYIRPVIELNISNIKM